MSVAGRPKCGQRSAVAKSCREASDHRAPHRVGTSARVTGSILLGVPQSESVLVVPLRSNASTLLAGAPIAAMRRRLKFASLFYDRLFLETGIFRVNAGPHGSSSFILPPTEGDPPRWQTPAERRARTGVTFAVAVSPDGRPDVAPRTLIASEATIAWTATLHPFAAELPSGTDWVEFRTSRDPAGEIQQLAQQWIGADERNRSLEQTIPIKFVRDTLIKSANRDLVLAAAAGVSVTTDRLHSQVVAQRFNDQPGWNLQGYAIPLLFPHAGELPWEAIADLRRDRNIARFRAVLREVEEEATAEAAEGNVKEAANRAYTRHLADASGRLEGVSSSVRRTTIGIVVSGAIGVATLPIPAPWGIVVGTAAGAVPTTITDVRNVIRQRRSRGWVALHQRIISGGQVAT